MGVERIYIAPIDLSKLTIRKAETADLPIIMTIEKESYPPDMHADEQKMIERLSALPEGQFLAYLDNFPVGYATNQIVRFSPTDSPKSWIQMTNGGYVTNTHDHRGNALYFISTGVRPPYRRSGIGSYLYDRRLKLAEEFNLDFAFADFRIQTLRQNLKEVYGIEERDFLKLNDMQIKEIGRDYLEKISRGVVKDPLNIMVKRGFLLLDVVPWYMGDVESLHVGAVMYKKL